MYLFFSFLLLDSCLFLLLLLRSLLFLFPALSVAEFSLACLSIHCNGGSLDQLQKKGRVSNKEREVPS